MQSLLITGARGFVGQYMVDFFKNSHNITTLGTRGEDICCDLSIEVPEFNNRFDCVVHLAGKAHFVPRSAEEAKSFFDVNYSGLKNLLTGIERIGHLPARLVLFSTVAVYGLESGEMLDERTPTKASDPYGKSKILAEELISRWGKKHNVAITILRPPLIVGQNPPGNLGDMIEAIKKRQYLGIGGGTTRRSMVLAHDIPPFIEKIWDKGGCYHITDGAHPSFNELALAISRELHKGKILNIPYSLAYLAARFFDVMEKVSGKKMPLSTYKLKKLMNSYTFSDSLARQHGWVGENVVSCVNKWVR